MALRTCRRRWTMVASAMVLLLASFCPAQSPAPESTVTLADAALAGRNFNRARSLYERALAQGAHFEGDPLHSRNIAAAFLGSSPPDLGKGIQWLRRAVDLDPKADGLRSQLAGFLLLSGNAEEAVSHYRILVEAHPGSTDYVLALARALQAAGRPDAALDLLRRTVDAYPNLVPIRVEYARRLNFEKRFAEAKQQFEAALAVEPGNVIAQVGSAKATSFEGDQETALASYNRILQRHPALYDAIVGKAFSLIWAGRSAEALPLLEQAMRRHPEDKEVRAALASLRVPSSHPGTKLSPARKTELRAPHAVATPSTRQAQPEIHEIPAREPIVTMATKALYPNPQAQRAKPEEAGVLPRSRILGYLGLVGLIAAVALPSLFRRRAKPTVAEEAERQASTEINFGKKVDSFDHADSFDKNAASAGREEPDFCRLSDDPVSPETSTIPVPGYEQNSGSAPISDNVASPAVTEAKQLSFSVRVPARPTGNVLLVGGSDHLVELESGWLSARSRTFVSQPEWIPAVVLLVNVSFDLIVLNPTTDDGWSSPRIFNWLVANLPQLCKRTLVVTNDAALRERTLDQSARHLFEPFGEKEWGESLDSVLQVAMPGRFAAGTAES